jgi:uncharacterized spore protein YtfJ
MSTENDAEDLGDDYYDDDFDPAFDDGAEERLQALELLFAGGDVTAAFGDPVASGGYTVIPAAEVAVAGGFGSGWGNAPGMKRPADKTAGETADTAETGRGGGGGGGGGSNARPVAVIVIGPDGVSVRPIFDYTKVGLALVTAMGAMWLAGRKMHRMAHMGHRHTAG